jgi:general secretion pathway protein K
LNSESQSDYFPPNRAFRTLQELHFVPEMTDDLFDLIESRVTIYGMKGINPNLATKEVLKSLDPGMTEEIVAAIIKRRDDKNEGGPFKDAKDFWGFVQSKNMRMEGKEEDVPLVFDSVFNFRIKSTGEYARSTSEITVIVMDFNKTVAKIKDYVDKDKKAQNPPTDPTTPPGGGTPPANGNQQPKTDPIAKGAPRIVYWGER